MFIFCNIFLAFVCCYVRFGVDTTPTLFRQTQQKYRPSCNFNGSSSTYMGVLSGVLVATKFWV